MSDPDSIAPTHRVVDIFCCLRRGGVRSPNPNAPSVIGREVRVLRTFGCGCCAQIDVFVNVVGEVAPEGVTTRWINLVPLERGAGSATMGIAGEIGRRPAIEEPDPAQVGEEEGESVAQ